MNRKETYRDLYHGTDAESASLIKKEGFKPSTASGNWCGSGVYFYDIKAKAWWSALRTCDQIKKARGRTVKAAIVYADIIDLDRDLILDLRAKKDLDDFRKIISPLLEKGKFKIDGIVLLTA
jgi:hypothetical protein